MTLCNSKFDSFEQNHKREKLEITMSREKSLLTAIIIGFMMIIGFSIGLHYTKKTKQYYNNYQECQWIGDYIEKGCIRHHIFYLIRDQINVTVMIDPNLCEINNPYHEDMIYWCGEIRGHYVETRDEYLMVLSNTIFILATVLGIIIICVILCIIFLCIEIDLKQSPYRPKQSI